MAAFRVVLALLKGWVGGRVLVGGAPDSPQEERCRPYGAPAWGQALTRRDIKNCRLGSKGRPGRDPARGSPDEFQTGLIVVFNLVGLATSLLEALVDDLGQKLVDVPFAYEDQPRAHDEQVVKGAQRLREI